MMCDSDILILPRGVRGGAITVFSISRRTINTRNVKFNSLIDAKIVIDDDDDDDNDDDNVVIAINYEVLTSRY